ncbi:MAG TPA: tetratricopeptide repeat protein [Rhizomicrobium sp.]
MRRDWIWLGLGIAIAVAAGYWSFQHIQPPPPAPQPAADAAAPAAAAPPDRAQAELVWARGLQAQEQGNIDEALAAFSAALGYDSSFAEADVSRGNALLSEQQYADAIQAYSDALTIDPDQADAYLGRATVHWLQGDLASAETDFETLTSLRPDDMSYAVKYVTLLYDEGKKDKVLDYYNAQYQQDPSRDWVVAGLLGAVKENAPDERQGYEACLARARQMWDAGTQSNAVMFAIGDSLAKLGQVADAIQWLAPLADKDPNEIAPDTINELAGAYRLTNDQGKCVATWRNYMQRMGRFDMFDEAKANTNCLPPAPAP